MLGFGEGNDGCDELGPFVKRRLGMGDRFSEGLRLGSGIATLVGNQVGMLEGFELGFSVGSFDGLELGCAALLSSGEG